MNTKSQTQSVQISGQPPKLNPDFISHRLSDHQQIATPLSLADSISILSNQAIAVLNTLAGHFIGNSDDINPEQAFWTIEAAVATIKDINAIAAAYHAHQVQLKNDQA